MKNTKETIPKIEPKELREKLKEIAEIGCLKMAKIENSETDHTKKFLFELFLLS